MSRTVLIVDDHEGFRASARRLLEAGGYSVIAEAADGSSGVIAAADSRPIWPWSTSSCPISTASRSPGGCGSRARHPRSC